MNGHATGRWGWLSAAALGLALLLPSLCRAQSTVTLRPDARVPAGEAVTLAQIALLGGAEAEALGGVVIEDAAGSRNGEASVEVRQVRAALERTGVDWAKVTLRGSSCTLLVAEPRRSASGAPERAAAAAANRRPTDGATVREAVLAKIARFVGVGPEDLRIGFDAADAALLATATAGSVVEVRPLGTSERMPLGVTVYRGERIAATGTVRATVLVRRQVAVLAAAKDRGEVIGPADVTTHEQWLGPNVRVASPAEVVGSAARGRLRVGAVVLEGDIEAPIVVQKGELVSIHCVSGGVVLRTTGRALGSARDGEVVRFESLEPPERRGAARTFYARMSGRGRAVAVAGSSAAPVGGRAEEMP